MSATPFCFQMDGAVSQFRRRSHSSHTSRLRADSQAKAEVAAPVDLLARARRGNREALAGLVVLVRAPGHGSAPELALGVPAMACLALVAGLLGPNLPLVLSRQPFDPRQYVSPPPPDPRAAVNPLDEVSAWLQNPDVPLFTVRASSAQDWRLAALDRFDGTTWSSSATLVPAGTRVPPSPVSPGPAATDVVDQRVTIQEIGRAHV